MSNTFNHDTEAQLTKIKTGLATVAEIIGEEGEGIQAHVEALAAERDLLAKHGLQHPVYAAATSQNNSYSEPQRAFLLEISDEGDTDLRTFAEKLLAEYELLTEFVAKRRLLAEFEAERESLCTELAAQRKEVDEYIATGGDSDSSRVSFAAALPASAPSDSEG